MRSLSDKVDLSGQPTGKYIDKQTNKQTDKYGGSLY